MLAHGARGSLKFTTVESLAKRASVKPSLMTLLVTQSSWSLSVT